MLGAGPGGYTAAFRAADLGLEVTLVEDDAFNNKLTVALKPKRALSEVELDAYNLEIKSVTVDGAPATFKVKADPALRHGTLTVKSAKGLAAGVPLGAMLANEEVGTGFEPGTHASTFGGTSGFSRVRSGLIVSQCPPPSRVRTSLGWTPGAGIDVYMER